MRFDHAQEPVHGAGVIEIAIDQMKAPVGRMGILINGIKPSRIKRTRTTDDPVNPVAFLQEQFGEIGAVLACDPRDESAFHAGNFLGEKDLRRYSSTYAQRIPTVLKLPVGMS